MNDRLDNYFKDCPAMMEDGRMFTDYRSSQIREEIFRHKNCVRSENEARTLRINNSDNIIDSEWEHNVRNKSCWPRTKCFHHHPSTRVTTMYNNAEMLAYNGLISQPQCNTRCHDYRLTVTPGSRNGRNNCETSMVQNSGYPKSYCPLKCVNTNRITPDNLYILPHEK